MSYNNNGGNNNSSNLYNYIGSEAHVRSLENDAWHDQIAARRNSKRAFANGESEGYRNGWCDAIAQSDTQVHKGNAEIERLFLLNQEQASRIEALEKQHTETVAESEDAIAQWQNHSDKLKTMIHEQRTTIEAAANENTTLKGLLTSLTEANQRLNQQINQQTENHEKSITEVNKQLTLYERNQIFIYAISRAIVDVLSSEDIASTTLKKAFQKHYFDCVLEAQESGLIEHQLVHDEQFSNSSPEIKQTILRLLDDATINSVFDLAETNELQFFGPEEDLAPAEYPFPEH
ncbi:hypothetical protein DFR26_2217 [Paraperlucidibaca baekdonensis]|uniref:Uncharacterized protein n=1 Tax=Paraperlucidibaca baekdonensis TaxID=748120 RepID=A0A3E0GZN1_9GAMM|nr:hypothetical protein [Paraperlucidibaca baekdonensis]REH35611.1 hypothetical protein DFR26_2217 [Paraperlucidibaca baekdonensis]